MIYFFFLEGIISLVGLFGNSIVASIIFSSRRRGRRSAVQLFLLHLAISDLLVCIVCIPLTIWINFYYPEQDKPGAGAVCKIARYVQVRTFSRFSLLYKHSFNESAGKTHSWNHYSGNKLSDIVPAIDKARESIFIYTRDHWYALN